MFTFTKLFATMHSKKRKTVSSIYGSQLHQCWTHKRFLQLKSIAVSLTHTWHKIGPKSVLGRQTKTTACLKQSTLGICIRTSISLQCKLLSKEHWICFANERIPINPWNLIVHGLYFLATTFFQSGISQARNQDFMPGGANEALADPTTEMYFLSSDPFI